MDCPGEMSFFYNIQSEKGAKPEQGMEEESESEKGGCLEKYESEASSEHE